MKRLALVLFLLIAVAGGVVSVPTSAAPPPVTLVHVEPSGADYTGNPYCPDTIWTAGIPTVHPWHDCNNITSQYHVIRTADWLASYSAPTWIIESHSGALAAIEAQGRCGNISLVTSRASWDAGQCTNKLDDDGDLVVNDGCPKAASDDEDNDLTTPGIQKDGVVNDGCLRVASNDDPADDTMVNDGCLAVAGAGENDGANPCDLPGATANCSTAAACATTDAVDDDADTVVNDGCDKVGNTAETLAQCIDAESVCTGAVDDDGDTTVNDGCPTVGTLAETAAQCIDAESVCAGATDDDGDTLVNDGCPAVGAGEDPDDQQCVVIHSFTPGETRVTLNYKDEAGLIRLAGPVVKEWDSLVDSVILKYGDLEKVKVYYDANGDTVIGTSEYKELYLPPDVNGDGVRDTDDEHLLDKQGAWQNHAVVWDEAAKRIKSAPPVEITELVHGEHLVLLNGVWGLFHQPTEGALVLAEIESESGCTFFTDAAGSVNYGATVTGVSDNLGRFVVWLDTDCEEQAEIHFNAQYPNLPGSLRLGLHEWIGINWTTALLDLVITKTASPAETTTVVTGGTITYTLTVSNTAGATGTATNVSILDYMGDGLTYVSATGTGVTCTHPSAQQIDCTVASLAPGASATVTVVATVSATSGSVLNGAYVDPANVITETNEDADDPNLDCSAVGEGTTTATEPDNFDCTRHALTADDSDGDGLPDYRDGCPLVAEDFDGFQDADGCPEADNDMDGICDPWVTPSLPVCIGSDACPNVPEDYDAFQDTDGCPDPDNDRDFFPDFTDQCPGTDASTGDDGIPCTNDPNEVNTCEDYDGIIDTDGCHDSPGDDHDGDSMGRVNKQGFPVFWDEVEVYLGTDPLDACPDGPTDDAWPLDINMDLSITMADVFRYSGRLWSTGGPPPNPMWMQRLDLNMDNFITMAGDVFLFRGMLGKTCT